MLQIGQTSDCVVFNNILITKSGDPGPAILYDPSANHTIVGNYVGAYGSSLLAANFEDPTNGIYSLTSNSLFKDAGVPSATNSVAGTKLAPAIDFDGNPRPQPQPNGAFDQGAFEYTDGAEESYLLETNQVGSGHVTRDPNRTTYTSGQQIVLTAVPDAGWVFSAWSGGVSGSTNPATLTITNNTTVTATFITSGPQPPVPPNGVSLTEITQGCLRASWQPSLESDLAGYKVFYGLSSVEKGQAVAYSDTIDAGNVTSKDVCALAPGRYYVAVQAYNTAGENSGYSAERNLYVSGTLPSDAFDVSRWTLDESSGNFVQDSWGSSGGTLVNGPAWRSTGGEMNGALEFDGANDYVDLTTMDVPDGTGFSIAFWFRADDFDNTSARFISKALGTAEADHYWMVGTVNSTGLRFRLKTNGVTTTLETSTGQIQTDRWYHIAATYDGARMRIYKNGAPVAETVKTGIVDRNSNVHASLGNQPAGAGSDRAFDGLIDDVRVYRRGLAEAEIDALVALVTNTPPLAKFTAAPTSGYAPLDVAFDASASSDVDGDPLSFSWDFGDGTTGSGASVHHEFRLGGAYTVTLVVRDDGGKTDTQNATITAEELTGPPTIPVWGIPSENPLGCASLAWQPNTEADLAGYVVYFGSSSVIGGGAVSYTDYVDVGDTTKIAICDLSQGTYYFALRAYDITGEYSGYSAERELYIQGVDLTPPSIIIGTPTDGAVDTDPGTSVFFVLSDGQSGIDTNSVTVSINGSAPGLMMFSGDLSSYAVVCEPGGQLPPRSTINVSVSASDRASPPNTVVGSWSFATGSTPPGAPVGLQAGSVNDGCVEIAWNPNPEPDIEGYTVCFGTSSVALGQTVSYSDSLTIGATVSQIVCGLVDGRYYFAVRARNTSGQSSGFSGEIAVDVASSPPDRPLPPQQLQLSEVTLGCLSMTWQANSEPDIAGYVVYTGRSSVVSGDAIHYEDSLDVGNVTSKEMCGFVAGVRYVAVRARNSSGVSSEYSTEKRIEVVGQDTEPPAVLIASPADGATGVRQDTDILFVLSDDHTGVDKNSVTIRINGSEPAQAVFSGDPSQYAVVCTPAGELPELSLVTVTVSVSDLAPTPNRGTSSWKFTTVRSRPSNPQGLLANGTDEGCAVLNWTANPENDVTGYRIYFGTNSVENGTASSYADSITVGLVTSHTMCGLIDDTYYFALRARNASGRLSDFSQEATAVVTTGVVAGPMPPQQFQVFESEPGCVQAAWVASAGPNAIGYVLYYRRQASYVGSRVYTDSIDAGNVTAKKICEFDEGTFCFAVRARDTAGNLGAYSTEKTLDVVGLDREGPKIVVGGPAHGAVNIRPSALVFFVVSDRKSGVDANTIEILINGSEPATVDLSGDASEYAVVCEPAERLPLNSVVRVDVTVYDLATPSNKTTSSWSFSTGRAADTAPPDFFSAEPRNGAAGVAPNARVTVGIRDESGIDMSSVTFYVNGDRVTEVSTRQESDGDVFIEYLNPHGFSPRSTVIIGVSVFDMAANERVVELSFETADGAPIGETVAIVPDGYWVDDPAKPLEVREIPPRWHVRIFSTEGAEVRHYENNGDVTIDWTWDFANDRGRRVAKSIYLVRVVDENGSVRKSGKFVVQSAAN